MALHEFLGGYVFKTAAFQHQYDDLKATATLPAFAFFWEQGTGKTKEIVDTAGILFEEKEINGIMNLAPQGIHRNFVTKALPVHMPDRISEQMRSFVWSTEKCNRVDYKADFERFMKWDGPFKCLSMSYDGIITPRGAEAAKAFMLQRKCLYAADETSRIKTEGAKRTRWVLASAKYAPWRRITNGTPVDNCPWDLRTQIQFLQPDFWVPHGMDSLKSMQAVFQDRHLQRVFIPGGEGKTRAVWVGNKDAQGNPIYKNLDRLARIIKPISSRVLKEQVLDLPPKLYSQFEFEMTKEQWAAYNSLKSDAFALLDDNLVTAELAITLLIRCQQIACGFVPTVDPADLERIGDESDVKPEIIMHRFDKNPRIDALQAVTEDLTHGCIIWARFQEDITQIAARLDEMKKTYVRYDGSVGEDERAHNEDAFQRGDAQFFLGNPQVGGEGLTLTAARTMVYYNNSFKLRERLQSEDRAHRIGQTFPVNYIDLVAAGTVDERLVNALLAKYNVAALCTGDRVRQWLKG